MCAASLALQTDLSARHWSHSSAVESKLHHKFSKPFLPSSTPRTVCQTTTSEMLRMHSKVVAEQENEMVCFRFGYSPRYASGAVRRQKVASVSGFVHMLKRFINPETLATFLPQVTQHPPRKHT